MFDVETIRADFPAICDDWIYFDSACMSLKPRSVLAAMQEYYEKYSGCHGRSGHRFSKKTTEKFEESRRKVAKFVNADAKEIVFTRNTTEGINLLAQQFLISNSLISKQGGLRPVVVTTDKEHNSNLVPWLRLKKRGVIDHVIVKTNADGTLDPKGLEKALSTSKKQLVKPTKLAKLVSLGFTSNLDGMTIPAAEVIEVAREHNFLTHLDAAQTAPHTPIDVKNLNVDFLTFSGHKMLGPTGTGVFYGKKELLEEMEPLAPGGGTVVGTTLNDYEFLTAPEKFEGGLQNYAGMIGLGAAVDYLQEIGLEAIHQHEIQLNTFLREEIGRIGRISLIGPVEPNSGVTSFTVDGMEPHQVALLLDKTEGIMVRSGQFCVHSWFDVRGLGGAVRVSLYLYDTEGEVTRFVKALKQIVAL